VTARGSGAMSRVAPVVAWALAGVVVVQAIAYVILYLLILSYPFRPYGFPGAVILFCVPAALFGAMIVARQSRNGVGWALILSGLFLATTSTAQIYTIRGVFVDPGGLPLVWMSAWFGSWMWAPGVAIATVFLPLFFPDSSLEGRVTKVLTALSVLMVLSLTVVLASFTYPGTGAVQVGPDAQLGGRLTGNHLGVFSAVYSLIPILAVAALVRLGFRLRRSTGEQRQQFKWFAYACGVVVVGVAASAVGNILSAPTSTNEPQGTLGAISSAILVGSLIAIPIGTGISVLKYRLYDIDIVINRTIVYGLLAVLITAVYVGIVAGVGSVVHSAGGGNLALSIGATAIVAVAFQPLRSRLQRFANRLVYGKQATPYEVLSAFSEGVAETYAEEEVLGRMARLVADATTAERAEVWIAVGPALRRSAAWPPGEVDPAPVDFDGNALPPLEATTSIPVRHRGELLGALTVTKHGGEDLKPVEAQLLEDLARQAGLVLRTAGLTESLKARLGDLRESRQRLVAAQDQERRRLERNLHDGAQQNLVALKVKLGLAKTLAASDPEKASQLLDQLTSDADDAIETLRDLARGIYPPLLADKGLAAAIESQARKATLPVSLDADGVGRYSQETEAAAYFCCLEALQNIQKYAGASNAWVQLAEVDGVLTVAIKDDGNGFDPKTARKGSGLQNMEDRLDALGGGVEIVSSPGSGATVRIRLPIGVVSHG
jgi:signal transduction histidine kinase